MNKLILSVAVAISAMSLVAASAFALDATWVHPGGIKFCSPFVAGNWRSTTPVPQNWTVADCQAFMTTQGANSFQVGCLYSTGNPPRYAFGAVGGAVPSPNCGW